MVTGNRLFVGNNDIHVIENVRKFNGYTGEPGMQPQIVDVISKCLEKNYQKRINLSDLKLHPVIFFVGLKK
jgi:serine/threonine protein kinase